MKTINDIKHLILVCIFIPIFTSCNNWLAVDMEDGMLEDKLYESNEGYMTVLNGVYARLNENYSFDDDSRCDGTILQCPPKYGSYFSCLW